VTLFESGVAVDKGKETRLEFVTHGMNLVLYPVYSDNVLVDVGFIQCTQLRSSAYQNVQDVILYIHGQDQVR
jgi:hypothetical protein